MDSLEMSAISPEKKTDQNQEEGGRDCKSNSSKNSSPGLLSYADRIDFFLMLFGAIGSCIHGAALPVFFVLFGKLIDSLGTLSSHPQRLVSEVSKQSLQLVYLGFVVMVSAWIGVAFWTQTGERQAARLRVKYIQSVLKQDMTFFDVEARNENLLYHISNDAILIQDAIGDKLGHSLRYLAQFSVGFIIGFLSVWKLTLLTLAIVPLMVVAGGTYAVVMSTLSKKGEAAYAEAGKVAEEVLSQICTVISYVGEDKAIKSYSSSLKNALTLGKKGGLAKGLGVGSTYGLLFCAWALLLWYAGLLVRHEATSGGKAFTTILNVIFSGFALGQAVPNLSALAKGRAAAANMINMIEKDTYTIKKEEDQNVLHEIAGEIEFQCVSFTYPSRNSLILDNLSVSIRAGKSFAVVGPSGSGKSTIISLIERFYEPQSGKILLDGHDVNNLSLKWLRDQIGLVSQEPALFSTSIASNILYGKEDANMDDVVVAAKIANAHSFIHDLPNGYSTEVGEGASQLSGGQKQRIAIARAVLRNPKILLLDEPTSALDAESEHLVQLALEGVILKRTTVIVAHRLSTIRNADTIAVLKNGKIVEIGAHKDLIAKGDNGEYAKLLSSQLLNSSQCCSHSTIGRYEDSSQTPASTKIIKSELSLEKAESIIVSQEMIKSKTSSMSQTKPSMWAIIRMNKSEWPYALLGSFGAILAGAEGPLFAFGISHILDAFYSHDNLHIKNEIRKLSLVFIGAAIVTVPVYLLQHYFYTFMGENLTMRIRLSMFSAILRNEVAWFDLEENNSGRLASALAIDATFVRAVLADRMSTVVQNVSLTVTAFTIALVLSWRMASVVIATLPLLISASIAEHLFLKGFGGNYSQAYARSTSVAREAMTNIRTVAAFNLEERVASHFIQELDRPNRHARMRGHISGLCYGFSQLCAFCSYALGLWYGSKIIRNGESTFGDVMKSFMVIIISAFGIAETLALAPDIVRGSEALASVFSILDRKTAIEPDDPSSEIVTEVRGEIEFRNVFFKYPTRPDITILKDLNLQVPAGSILALVGQSGSGKSSLISLLMRFYDPTSGLILVDGKDIRGLNLRSLRQRIGLVQQEPALFSTTIYENISYGRDGASEIEIMKAAKAANAHTFISHMPEGYMTQVGEHGAQLSGGQKQRIAIARAILKDPSVLLLDEATSALDTTSEKVVQEALNRLMEGRTTVIVAHRLSTVRDADIIAVLQDGRVMETGRHEDLIRRPGSLYADLVHLQQQSSSSLT